MSKIVKGVFFFFFFFFFFPHYLGRELWIHAATQPRFDSRRLPRRRPGMGPRAAPRWRIDPGSREALETT